MSFLTERLGTLCAEDEALDQRLRGLFRDLESEEFEKRQQARRALAALGPMPSRFSAGIYATRLTWKCVRRRGSLPPSADARTDAGRPAPSPCHPDSGRHQSPEARRLLGKLADGQPEHVLTQEARAALVYLTDRPVTP